MFEVIQFDVSGICNARCSWCVSGRRNRNKQSSGKFINVEEFKRTIYHLLENGFIEQGRTWLALYMWGDPFLHPRIKEIIKFLNQENVLTGISTNASKPVFFEEEGVLSNIRHIWFSMPGFSQSSYDKSHGFNFEKILLNIKAMAANYYKMGCSPGKVIIIFHMYQYNLLELGLANEFARQNKLGFWPYAAGINDYELMKKYMKSEMDYELLKKASTELFLYNLTEEFLAKKPEGFVCPQFSQITLNEDCRALQCCGRYDVDLGSIFDLKPQDINNLREQTGACTECRKLNIDFHRVLQINEILPLS
ncbi:Radical SAM domain protein [Syntrophobotulus glycolicus DSM 8271]|uniref:Radical SAM domain protein n=1 Tax=Syntrophobotulus glycolicus (strain DSM 8271 / FlGlyR) TaxID=645991 RepID=F0SX63_SYNGF|nr:Radical SAM domain protein [Syntrophobotulus glycolicus DSM 8271]